jgi:tRNA A-37 threonylcarbamoyl transferase component Bud32
MADWNSIVAEPQHAGKRVFPVMLDGERYWVKRSRKNYKNLYQVVLHPNLSALRDETRAMRHLRLKGMLVPTVVHETPEFIVLTDTGESLQRCLQRGDEALRMRYVLQVADLLSELHARKAWHGNAALRNFTVQDGRLAMIDFENTAHRWLTLDLRQAFDIWQVLHSIAQYEEHEALGRAFLARYRTTSRSLLYLRMIAWGLSPVYLLLAPFSGLMKRDIREAVESVGGLLVVRPSRPAR